MLKGSAHFLKKTAGEKRKKRKRHVVRIEQEIKETFKVVSRANVSNLGRWAVANDVLTNVYFHVEMTQDLLQGHDTLADLKSKKENLAECLLLT